MAKNEHNRDDITQNPIDFLELVTQIPVGVCKFLTDDSLTLIHGNPCLYAFFGYTREQFHDELHDEITRTFLTEDRSKVTGALIAEHRSGKPGFRLEHRIIRRDGSVIWVLVSGSFTTHNGAPAAYGVVVDITDRKKIEEQLRIDEERFRIALAQTDNTIFDYHIATKVMIHADKSAAMYGLAHETHNVPDFLVEQKVIHPDHASEFLEMYQQISSGAPTASCIIRAQKVDGQYAWRKITMTNIYDQSGNAVRAVGMLEDIDEQTRREATLLERSQRDPLTALYNKGTTESQIKKLLDCENHSGVLFIIDVDSFKGVNDHYGHLFGDFVLSEGAQRIIRLCRHEDIIGRVGGDEFLLYLQGSFTATAALHKANEICAAFAQQFSHKGVSATITCTVGLAIYPIDGDCFETLYQKADIALYHAKRNGKNRSCLYNPGMGSHLEWVPYSNTQIDEPVSIRSLSPNL